MPAMDIPTHRELVEQIDAFLARHKMAETRLGRATAGEASLIATIRAGRQPRLDTLNRLAAFMAEHEERNKGEASPVSPGNGGDLTADAQLDAADAASRLVA
jgi:homoserine dehydrogenase